MDEKLNFEWLRQLRQLNDEWLRQLEGFIKRNEPMDWTKLEKLRKNFEEEIPR